MKTAHRQLSPRAVELVASRFRVLGEPARLSILNALMAGEHSVNELVEQTGLSQANVSKHLAGLSQAGFVAREKRGLFTIYSIADASLFKLCDLMCSSVERKLGEELKLMR
ncbi:HTH-type transcriptional repressor CzrA [Gammaproteobacteria bacterium]|nr:HTH-type transcriptional repressor CzrA [Gammaproteobacteria bacterium]